MLTGHELFDGTKYVFNGAEKHVRTNVASFAQFKEAIKRIGGIWDSGFVRFTQYQDGYAASYKPEFPKLSQEDCSISYDFIKNVFVYYSPEGYSKEYRELAKRNEIDI